MHRRGLTSITSRVKAAIVVSVVVLLVGAIPALRAARRLAHSVRAARPVAIIPEPTSMRSASFVLECGSAHQAISPYVYGVGGAGGNPWNTGTTARRWGGNPTTRYNWQLNTWNLSKDWFFRNAGEPGSSYETFLDENLRHNVETAFTVPMIGWVAKDANSYSFPVTAFGPQQASGWDVPDSGNGVSAAGEKIVPLPPTQTSVPAPPEFIEEWITKIREHDPSGRRSVDSYILDNEPMLWNETHRDVHPDPTTYDELLERTIAYGTAIRRADPGAKIAGPAEWGWTSYQYSAKDTSVRFGTWLKLDRRMHGNEPLIPWYLRKLREYEQKTGTRLLDILDVHFYPTAPRVGIGPQGSVDSATAALRIRSTRSLWDPTYVDESWIHERMMILPLLRQWIAENNRGLKISIGEWNFGAENHMSGGLAAAEVLGRFATEGVYSAYYWTSPPEKSPAYWAFRAFRNFDGSGKHFLDFVVPVEGKSELASVFASTDSSHRHLVAIVLNFATASPLSASFSVKGCGNVAATAGFTYAGGPDGFQPLATRSEEEGLGATVNPYSMTVLDFSLQ